jgi:hypothetical protein
MSIWYHSGEKFVKASWFKKELNLDAYLICTGPSLAKVNKDIRGSGRKIFGINTSYPKVIPDVWMGMDEIDCYDKNILYEPFPKVFRGSYEKMSSDGKSILDFPEVYFASVTEQPGNNIFTSLTDEFPFVWKKNTLYICIQLMIKMGAKKIHFVGCDLGGDKDYFDNRVLKPEQRKYNRELYSYQLSMLKDINELCKKNKIQLISCTDNSPINNFMEYNKLDDAIKLSESNHKIINKGVVKHCLDLEPKREVKKTVIRNRDKIAVITPTRGDRKTFLDKCKSYVANQTIQPHEFIVVDYVAKPIDLSPKKDQANRIIEGVNIAKKAGCSRVIIMEDDDYYANTYIENIFKNWSDEFIIGGDSYHCYHILLKKYLKWGKDVQLYVNGKKLPKGSPLSQTSFTIKFFDNFLNGNMLGRNSNLDVDLWSYSNMFNLPRKLISANDLFLSVKHNISLCAGGLHSAAGWSDAVEDPEFKYLERIVGVENISFYKQLHESKHDSTLR